MENGACAPFSIDKYNMSKSSLANMSVPGMLGNFPMTMPRLQNRWRVSFWGFGGGAVGTGIGGIGGYITHQAVEIQRPKIKFPEVAVNIYGSKMYLPGKYNWETITLKIRDDANNDLATGVATQLRKQLDFQELTPGFNVSTYIGGDNFKFTTWIDTLDGGSGLTPTVIDRWKLFGCILTSTDLETLNYNSSEPVTVTLTIRFDNAELADGVFAKEPAGTPAKISNHSFDGDTR